MCKYLHTSGVNKNGRCKQCAIDAVMRYHWKNRDKELEKMRQYDIKTGGRKAYRKKYNKENREHRRLKSAEWHYKNKDRTAKYRDDRKSLYAAHARNRRARIAEVGGVHNAEDIENLLFLQKFKCPNCGACVKDKFHVDHITPIALGGHNDKRNLQILCPSCNLKKNRKDPIVWAQENGRLL